MTRHGFDIITDIWAIGYGFKTVTVFVIAKASAKQTAISIMCVMKISVPIKWPIHYTIVCMSMSVCVCVFAVLACDNHYISDHLVTMIPPSYSYSNTIHYVLTFNCPSNHHSALY